jgi:hypothetical protein
MFVNELANMSVHDDLLVNDELVVKNLKIPSNGTVTGLTIAHIDGLSDTLTGTIDETALLASVQSSLDAKADADTVYTTTQLDGFLNSKANATDVYTKTQVNASLANKADSATVNTQLGTKADVASVYTQTELDGFLNTKANSNDVYLKSEVDTAISGFATTTELQTKADLSSVYDRSTIDANLQNKANSTDVYSKPEVDLAISGFATTASVNTQLQNKADVSSVYTQTQTNTLLDAKANATQVYERATIDSALATKVNTTDLTTQLQAKANQTSLLSLTETVNTKANQSDLETTNTNLTNLTDQVYTQSEITNLLAGKVDTGTALIQTGNEIIIPQRGIPYPPKNIAIPSGNYGGGYDSSTAWASSWTISTGDFTNVNGLRRKTYGVGSYALSNMTHENSSADGRFVELTLPYAVVASGVEAVQRPDGEYLQYNSFPGYDSASPNGWQTFAWDATNSTWVEMNMDNSQIQPLTPLPGVLPTTFREITGNTLSSNKYRVMVCEDRVATAFDGFRIYSKDESPPAIPLGDVIESLIELNTFH